MKLAEFKQIIDQIPWIHINHGSYNSVYRSAEQHTIEGQTGYWVRKDPLEIDEEDNDLIDAAMCDSERAVRKWNTVNPLHPAWQIDNRWIAPYVGEQQATDLEIAKKVVQIFQLTGEIIVDACGQNNFLTHQGQVFCVDVDLALRRNSIASENYYNTVVIRDFDQYTSGYASSRPLTVAAIKTLLYIEAQCNVSTINYSLITHPISDKLRLFRLQQKPISPTMLNVLALIPANVLAYEYITPDILIQVDQKCQAAQTITQDMIHSLLQESIDQITELAVFAEFGIGWSTPAEHGRFFQSLSMRHACTGPINEQINGARVI